jgi:hypothetical protein
MELTSKQKVQALQEVAEQYHPDSVPGRVLRDEIKKLDPPIPDIEPGHVWYRSKLFNPHGRFRAGLLTQDNTLVLDNGAPDSALHEYEIRPVRATGPVGYCNWQRTSDVLMYVPCEEDELEYETDPKDFRYCPYCRSSIRLLPRERSTR